MADDIEDPYAFIIDNCQHSFSQEDFLLLSNFAREDDTFSVDFAGKSPPADYSVINISESVVGGDSGDSGFRGERNGSPKLKKVRVLGDEGGSPLVHCSGINASEVVFEGDVKVKVVRPLRCVAPDGVECNEGKLGFEDCGEGVEENRWNKELEFGGGSTIEVIKADGDEGNVVKNGENLETEVIEVEEEEENVVKNGEYVETEVIEVGDEEENGSKIEDVAHRDTELIDVNEEGRTSKNEAIANEDDENHMKVEISDFDKGMIEFEEVGGIFEEVDEGTSKDEEIDNVDMKVVGVDEEEQGNCAKGDGETSNVDMEEIVVEEKEDNGDENGKFGIGKEDGEGTGKCNEDVLSGEGTRMSEEEMKGTKRKRKLPRSMFEQWGEGLENGEGCSKDARVEGNGKSKDGCTTIRCILDALKFIVGEKSYTGGEVDFFETAKRRGMMFPRPRFRPSMEDDA